MPVLTKAQQKQMEERETMVASLPVQLLRDAADYITEHGWTRGVYERETGEVCTEGALLKEGSIGLNHRLGFAWGDELCGAKKEAELRLLRSLAKRGELDTCFKDMGNTDSPYAEVPMIWLVEHGNIAPEAAVCAWNDSMKRSQEDVLLALKCAIEDG